MDKLFIDLKEAIINGQTQTAMDKTKLLLRQGVGVHEIIKKQLTLLLKNSEKRCKMEKSLSLMF